LTKTIKNNAGAASLRTDLAETVETRMHTATHMKAQIYVRILTKTILFYLFKMRELSQQESGREPVVEGVAIFDESMLVRNGTQKLDDALYGFTLLLDEISTDAQQLDHPDRIGRTLLSVVLVFEMAALSKQTHKILQE
jgi:hypothetical protein